MALVSRKQRAQETMLSPCQRQKARGDQGNIRDTGMGETGGSGTGIRSLVLPHWLSQGKPSALWERGSGLPV